jgi:uncharacterized membrane protein (DUF2068 family)
VAGVLIGLEGVCVLGFTAFLLLQAGAATLGAQAVLGEAGMFLLVGGAMVLLGVGLWRGRPWARTPAIVIQLLLLPAVYSLIGPSRQVAAGLVAAVVVLAALLALLSEPARRWSTELDEVRRRD